jgi:hypothetical protein
MRFAAATDAVAANGVGSIDITPLDFMLGLMADPNLRFKAAAESAKYVHPKPAGTSGDAAGAGPMIIDATSDADRARIDERLGPP